LNYELDTYIEALEDIPQVEKAIQVESGPAFLQKTDIFRKIMWFSFKEENTWHPVATERVHEIIAMNKDGKKPATLLDDEVIEEPVASLNSDLVAMDRKFRNNQKNNNRKRKKHHKKRAKNHSNQKFNKAKDA